MCLFPYATWKLKLEVALEELYLALKFEHMSLHKHCILLHI